MGLLWGSIGSVNGGIALGAWPKLGRIRMTRLREYEGQYLDTQPRAVPESWIKQLQTFQKGVYPPLSCIFTCLLSVIYF